MNQTLSKKARSAHKVMCKKNRASRRQKAINMAVHLIMGGTSDKWTLSADQSTITFDHVSGPRVYPLTGCAGQIEALIAERTEANAKRAEEKAKADEEKAKAAETVSEVVTEVKASGPKDAVAAALSLQAEEIAKAVTPTETPATPA